MTARARRTYDHRLRELVYDSGSLKVAERAGVCRRTAKSWLRRGVREVVTSDLAEKDAPELRADVLRLEHRVEVLFAIIRLLWMLVRLRGARLDGDRLPEGEDKQTVLKAVQRATKVLKPDTALRLLGVSSARYHAWRQPLKLCQLDDVSSCPKTTPTQLTQAEVRDMHAIVMDPAFRHIPVSRLAVLRPATGESVRLTGHVEPVDS